MATPNDDTLARARERLAGLRAADALPPAGGGCEFGAIGGRVTWFGPVGPDGDDIVADVAVCYPAGHVGASAVAEEVADKLNAAPALLDLADAVARLAEGGDWDLPWWRRRFGEDWSAYCIGCGNEGISAGPMASMLTHAPDCPALAIDAALARLAGEF